ncbi:MAG: BrnT family toxin [Deltaproteobacteria bacterium]|nr:BrnT family toxin [Deltaproteobacteria bacterium]
MRFEWDPRKAVDNEGKHGISFEEAMTAFDDPMALRAPDVKHSTEKEERQWLIGETDLGYVTVVVFTVRAGGRVYRLISARHAGRSERRQYETCKKIPL